MISSRKKATRTVVATALVVASLGAGAAFVVPRLSDGGPVASAAAVAGEPVTAPAEWTTLTHQLRLNGQLTYGDAADLPAVGGMVTALPSPGSIINRGEQVVEVDGAPVVLFTGDRPFWRDLSTGVAGNPGSPGSEGDEENPPIPPIPPTPGIPPSEGADVAQLQDNLRELGYFTGESTGVFGPRTREAVRQWQRSLGHEVTGEFAADSVMVSRTPAIRIETVTAGLGETAVSAGTFTETALAAVIGLTPSQAAELTPGTPVVVTLPDGSEIEAALTGVDPGGEAAADGSVTGPHATIDFPPDALPDGTRPGSIRVTVDDDAADATLVVPATAVLATHDGHAVEVWDGATIRTVPVELGLAADARVQVLGGELAEGDQVVIAR